MVVFFLRKTSQACVTRINTTTSRYLPNWKKQFCLGSFLATWYTQWWIFWIWLLKALIFVVVEFTNHVMWKRSKKLADINNHVFCFNTAAKFQGWIAPYSNLWLSSSRFQGPLGPTINSHFTYVLHPSS